MSGTGTITAIASPTTSVTGLSVGANVFLWTIYNGVCTSSTSTVSINVDANPSPSNAGSNQTICSSTSTFSATIPTVGTGTWTLVSGGGSATSVNTATSSVTGLLVGTNTFMWSVGNGTCPTSTSTVSIKVDANPSVASAGTNTTICSSTSTLSANIPTVGTGTWTVVSGNGIFTAPNSATSSVNSLNTGTNIFMWSIGNGTCPTSTSTVSIKVDANPSPSSAGSNQTICSSTSTFSATVPAVGTGTWTLVSGGGNATSVNTATSSVTGLLVGTNTFMWSVGNGTCPTSTSTVSIKVDANPTVASAGTNTTICSSTSTLSANLPTVGTGTWTVVSGNGIFTAPNSATSSVNSLNTGTNIFMWSIGNGTCPASTSTVSIKVDANPTVASAGTNTTICSSTHTMTANTPIVGIGTWNVLSGGANLSNINSPSASTTNLGLGQNIFIWSISNGTCPISRDTIIINSGKTPSTSNAGPNQNICINKDSTKLAASIPNSGNGSWLQIFGSSTIANPTQYNTSITNLATGQNTFVWIVSSTYCPSSYDTVTVTVFPLTTIANAGPDIIAYSPVADMAANTPINGNGTWTLNSGGGSFSNNSNPTTQITNLQFGQNIFTWTISNGVCPNSSDAIIVTLQELNVPNGFSPNGDGTNDNFEIPGLLGYTNCKLEVFNRWGGLVYQNLEYKNEWGGKNTSGEDLTDDTYYFTLEITGKKTYKGYLVLKRK